MKQIRQEFRTIFKKNGWRLSKDEVGQSVVTKYFGEIVVQLLPNVKKIGYLTKFYLAPGLGNIEFIRACDIVDGLLPKEKSFYYLIQFNELENRIYSPEAVEEYLAEVESWALKQDLQAAVDDYANLIPSKLKGIVPLYHLAALAMNKETQKLQIYLENFKQGDRMGFVPYIDEGYIERAIELSKKDEI